MKMKFKYFLLLVVTIIAYSCSSYKDIPYFQNSDTFDGTGKEFLYDMKIKPKDQLSIFVFCPNDQEAASQFRVSNPRTINLREFPIRITPNQSRPRYYLVENDGCINYPMVGKINLLGMTIEQAQKCISEKIAPYFQKDAEYIVKVSIGNYQVSVMGEVKNPNTFSVTRPNITILEALAMAGDMTIYGKRDNVKILRELADGTYEVHELDMRDANILNSPYYYLEQRDIVYVEPNEAMAQNSKIGRTTQLWVRGAAITISLGSLLYRVLQ